MISFQNENNDVVGVRKDNPLPIYSSGLQPSSVTPVSETFSASGASAKYITPPAGRAFVIEFAPSSFIGTVDLEYSYDGTTWYKIYAGGIQLKTWSAWGPNFIEQYSCDVTGAKFRLNCTAWTSGTLPYVLRA